MGRFESEHVDDEMSLTQGHRARRLLIAYRPALADQNALHLRFDFRDQPDGFDWTLSALDFVPGGVKGFKNLC